MAGIKWLSMKDHFTKFRRNLALFDEDDTDPVLYWQRFLDIKQYHDLASIAVRLLKFPQSNASVERSFSVIRNIHTWKRCSLHRNTLKKLIYIYANMRFLEEGLINFED